MIESGAGTVTGAGTTPTFDTVMTIVNFWFIDSALGSASIQLASTGTFGWTSTALLVATALSTMTPEFRSVARAIAVNCTLPIAVGLYVHVKTALAPLVIVTAAGTGPVTKFTGAVPDGLNPAGTVYDAVAPPVLVTIIVTVISWLTATLEGRPAIAAASDAGDCMMPGAVTCTVFVMFVLMSYASIRPVKLTAPGDCAEKVHVKCSACPGINVTGTGHKLPSQIAPLAGVAIVETPCADTAVAPPLLVIAITIVIT
jgi:hypothetical protein